MPPALAAEELQFSVLARGLLEEHGRPLGPEPRVLEKTLEQAGEVAPLGGAHFHQRLDQRFRALGRDFPENLAARVAQAQADLAAIAFRLRPDDEPHLD